MFFSSLWAFYLNPITRNHQQITSRSKVLCVDYRLATLETKHLR